MSCILIKSRLTRSRNVRNSVSSIDEKLLIIFCHDSFISINVFYVTSGRSQTYKTAFTYFREFLSSGR